MKRLIVFLTLAVGFLGGRSLQAQPYVKNGSTAHPLVFFMTDSTDSKSGKTGLAGSFTLLKIGKNGGTGVTPSGAVTEIDATNQPGWYKIAGNATDTNTNGLIALHATASGADPADLAVAVVVSWDPDATVGVQTWSEAIPGAYGAGTAGNKLNSAASAGDPWSTSLPGSYGAGTAGNILGNRLDQAISTRASLFDTEVDSGTAQGGSLTSVTLKATSSGIPDYATSSFFSRYGYRIKITGGPGAGSVRQINSYTGSSKIATVSLPFFTAPTSASTYVILP